MCGHAAQILSASIRHVEQRNQEGMRNAALSHDTFSRRVRASFPAQDVARKTDGEPMRLSLCQTRWKSPRAHDATSPPSSALLSRSAGLRALYTGWVLDAHAILLPGSTLHQEYVHEPLPVACDDRPESACEDSRCCARLEDRTLCASRQGPASATSIPLRKQNEGYLKTSLVPQALVHLPMHGLALAEP